MGFLDWMKNRSAQASKQPEQQVFLSFGERAALKRLVQHFDDGLVGGPERKPRPWEADLEATATRLGFRDPLGHAPVRLERNEAEAVRQFQAVCEKDAESGDRQVKSDIQVLRRALDRNGKPQELPAWELTNETASPGIPSATLPTAKELVGEESEKPSRPQSKSAVRSDRLPNTEAEVNADAFSKMGSVIQDIANDRDSDWSKHWVPFEEAVLGVRKAFASRIEMLYPLPEKGVSKALPQDAEIQRDGANPQQPEKGRNWER